MQGSPLAIWATCKAPPLQFVPPLTSHGMICDYIVWIDRDLHSYIEMKRDHFMTC